MTTPPDSPPSLPIMPPAPARWLQIRPAQAALLGALATLLFVSLIIALYLFFGSAAPPQPDAPQHYDPPPQPLLKTHLPAAPANLYPATLPDVDQLPPISLVMSYGALDEIERALTTQLGLKFGSDPDSPPDRYTFDLHNIPFSQVQQELAKKRVTWSSPARILKISDTISFYLTSPPCFGIDVLLSPLTPAGNPNNPVYNAELALSVDPRLEILKAQPPQFDRAVDDQSVAWSIRSAPAGELSGFGSWDALTFQRHLTFQRQPSANTFKATALARLTGTITVLQAVESQTVTLEDPGNNLDKPVSASPYEVTLSSANDHLTLNIRRTADPFPVDPSLPLNILIVDNTQTVWGLSALPPDASGQVRAVPIPPNFPDLYQLSRILVRYPAKIRDVTLPFEFKPVALP